MWQIQVLKIERKIQQPWSYVDLRSLADVHVYAEIFISNQKIEEITGRRLVNSARCRKKVINLKNKLSKQTSYTHLYKHPLCIPNIAIFFQNNSLQEHKKKNTLQTKRCKKHIINQQEIRKSTKNSWRLVEINAFGSQLNLKFTVH